MGETDTDITASEKLLEAVDRIRDMARERPEEAAAMLERAQYLAELAQQIKNDWALRCHPAPASTDAATGREKQSPLSSPSAAPTPETGWVVTAPSRNA